MAKPTRGAALGRREFLRAAGLLGAGMGLSLALGCSERAARPLTTLDSRIVLQEDRSLGTAPGEPYEVRTDLAAAEAGREERRRSLVAFHHFSDFRLVDEESPLRSEWVDSCPTGFSTSAFRPHEALSLVAAAAVVAQANRIDRSPATGRPVDFAVHTGNAADNAQYNELRWFLDLMDGRPLRPDSGSPGYEGVQRQSPLAAYPDLLEQAQLPFTPEALRYPWYAVLGNRDVLAQGNFPPNESANGIAIGSEKIVEVGESARNKFCSDPSGLLGPGSSSDILDDPQTAVRQVGADAARRLLGRKQWIEEHFQSAAEPGPPGHGFHKEERDKARGYYVIEHGPLAFIVLDTVNPGGFAAGSIDATQFKWLEKRLVAFSGRYLDADGNEKRTKNRDKLVVVVSHHGLEDLNNPFPDPDTDGERLRGPQLEELLHRFPNVVLHIAGHSLQHRIAVRPDAQGRTGGYWEVTTASPLDYPMQARLLEIVDNADGTLSIIATVYDTAAPLKPSEAEDPTEGDGVNERLLAALARQLGVQDPQLSPEAAGLSPSDRNAELLLPAPFSLAEVRVPGRHRPVAAASRRGLLRVLVPPLSAAPL